MRVASLALAGLVAGVVGGCGLFGEPPNLPCPRPVVLADASEVTQFRAGPGRDLTDVRFEGAITGIAADCEYDEDGFVDVELTVYFELTRGPAAEAPVGRFDYFVAITDPEERVIAKRVFTIAVEFASAAFRTAVTEELTQRIFYEPLADASGYRVFVGFQLTREQLEYRRRRR